MRPSHRVLTSLSALRNDDMGINAVHEDAVPRGEPAGEKTTGTGTSAFSADGSIGKQFKGMSIDPEIIRDRR